MGRYRWLCAALVLLWQATAFAQAGVPDDARERASGHFQRGVELFEDGAFRAALAEFRRAYEVAPNYRLLFNIGQTQIELQDFLGASQSYEDYLREGGSQIAPAQRATVEDSLQALRGRVGSIVLTVSRDGAEVFLDDALIGRSPIAAAIPVNAGQHRITARSPDGGTGTGTVEMTGGETAKLSIELSAPTPVASAAPTERGRPLTTKLGIAGWGVGGALLLGSVATGVLALSADKDLEDSLTGVNVDPNTASDQRSKLKTLVTTTDVLIATGAVIAVAGTVLYLLGRREEKRDDVRAKRSVGFDLGVGSLNMRGQF